MKTAEMLMVVLVLALVGRASAALVAYYEFEDNANDSSGNNLHGTAYGGPTYVPGVFGQALSLDGGNDYVDCGNSPLFNITSQITLAAWVKTNDCGNGDVNPYLTKGDAAYALKNIWGNEIEFAIYISTYADYRTAAFPVDSSFNGIWHHLAATYNGSQLKLYIDGVVKATSSGSGSIATNAFSLNIGGCSEVTEWLYNGLIDDVRIYNHALSAAEIEALATVSVDISKAFTYQGRLLDGDAPADGQYDLEFNLFDADEGSGQVGSAIRIEDINVVDGYFTVDLSFGEEVLDGNPRWLQIAVRPGNSTSLYTTLSPRQRVAPTPYALHAFSVAAPLVLSSSGTSTTIEGINTGTGAAVSGSGSSGSTGLLGFGDYAVYGESTNGTATIEGINSGTGAGVSGSGSNYGGVFVAASLEGCGVHGYASNTGYGTNYGGWFKAMSEKGRGVYGEANGINAEGVSGYSNGSLGHGVHGEASGYFGSGVYGYASGDRGSAVEGISYAEFGVGVHGYSFYQGVVGSGSDYDFYAEGPGIDYGSASSVRWKTDIQAIDNPLRKILDLRGVYFNWDAEHGGHHDVGMIAEEVGEVLPEIVGYEENGIDAVGMDYSKLTPLLVEAVKELKKEKDADIAELKSRLAEMELLQKENVAFKELLAETNARLEDCQKDQSDMKNRLTAMEALVSRLADVKGGR